MNGLTVKRRVVHLAVHGHGEPGQNSDERENLPAICFHPRPEQIDSIINEGKREVAGCSRRRSWCAVSHADWENRKQGRKYRGL